jgi:hypothetical protein
LKRDDLTLNIEVATFDFHGARQFRVCSPEEFDNMFHSLGFGRDLVLVTTWRWHGLGVGKDLVLVGTALRAVRLNREPAPGLRTVILKYKPGGEKHAEV